MMTSGLSVDELFSAVLNRNPTEWEAGYWGNELVHWPLDVVIRRFMDSDEHRNLLNNHRIMSKPAGHFYSPIVDPDFITERRDNIFCRSKGIDGIDMNDSEQKDFARSVNATSGDLPFQTGKTPGLRYHYDNNAFVWGDAVVYAAMLKKHMPKKIIEIGSGYSSALALDVIDMVDGYNPKVTLFDPYPELVENLLADHPAPNVTIEGRFIQDVPLDELTALEAGDFYFMDTTHVVKTGSDVLYHFEEVLPRLKSGVFIHIHDIFWPFEYPETWVLNDRLSWNELYYVRAFLTGNEHYKIAFFNDYMHKNYSIMFSEGSPFLRSSGASIWLRKE